MPITTSADTEPLYCPHNEILWYRVKLLPVENDIRIVVKCSVQVDYNELVAKPMVLVSTRTKLYMFQKEAVWITEELGDITVSVLNSKTFIHTRDKVFAVKGLSAGQRVTISEAVIHHRSIIASSCC